MNIIGIDPGIKGAICLITDTFAEVHDLPTTPHILSGKAREVVHFRNLVKKISEMAAKGKTHVYCEEVGPMPWDTPLTAWNFADTYRACRDAVDCCGLPLTLVQPVKWRRGVGMKPVSSKLPKAEQAKMRKEQARERAMQLFPGLTEKLHCESYHNRADALLIGWFGRNQ